MATEQRGFSLGTSLAGADLSLKQFYAVKLDTAGAIVLAGEGEFAIGVLQNSPASGEVADVMVSGVSKLVVAGTLTAGVIVKSDASGKGDTAGADDFILGVLTAGGTATAYASVLLRSALGI